MAAGKPCSMNSQYAGFAAARSVDGDINTFSHNNGGFGFWEVDLGDQTIVSSIIVENRRDCCQDRILNAVILLLPRAAVGGDLGSWRVQAAWSAVFSNDARRGGGLDSFGFNPGGARGRWVRIVQTNNYIHTAEVKVLGQPVPVPAVQRGLGNLGIGFPDSGTTAVVIDFGKGFPFPRDVFSITMWMKSSDKGHPGTPLSYATAADDNSFTLYDYNSLVVLRAGAVRTALSLTDGAWHFIGVTYVRATGEVRLYKDGRPAYPVAVVGQATPLMPDGVLVLGQEQDRRGGGFDANQAFRGMIDETALFGCALSEQDMQDMYANGTSKATPGLVSLWTFDECADGQALDQFGGHPARLVNAPGGCIPSDAPLRQARQFQSLREAVAEQDRDDLATASIERSVEQASEQLRGLMADALQSKLDALEDIAARNLSAIAVAAPAYFIDFTPAQVRGWLVAQGFDCARVPQNATLLMAAQKPALQAALGPLEGIRLYNELQRLRDGRPTATGDDFDIPESEVIALSGVGEPVPLS